MRLPASFPVALAAAFAAAGLLAGMGTASAASRRAQEAIDAVTARMSLAEARYREALAMAGDDPELIGEVARARVAAGQPEQGLALMRHFGMPFRT